MQATRFIDRAAQLVESWPAIALMWAGLIAYAFFGGA